MSAQPFHAPGLAADCAAPRYSPVLWDLDGTVIDSGREIIQRVRRVVDEFGYAPLSDRQLRSFIGPPLIESFITTVGMSREDAERATLRSREIARAQAPDYLVSVIEGMPEVIADLQRAGVPQAIASSKGQWLVEAVLDHFGLLNSFAVVSGADPQAGRTEKEEVIAHALSWFDRHDVSRSSAIMIGDRIHDLEGGHQHGLPVVIVEWGFGDGEATPGALARVNSVADLRNLLGV
jgi:phosphoglycolate phosphatase